MEGSRVLVVVLLVCALASPLVHAGVETDGLDGLRRHTGMSAAPMPSDSFDHMWFKVGADRQFQNIADGRNALFRGVDLCNKAPGYDYEDLDDEDFRKIGEWFNVVRMCIYWEAIEKVRGVYDMAYLQRIKGTVDRLASMNVSVIIDMHQDVYSNQVCGLGAPAWAVWESTFVSKVLAFPSPVEGVFTRYPRDPVTNKVLSCATSYWWGEFYLSATLGDAFHGLYSNKNGIRDSFINLWKTVATVFKDHGGVLGYELLNEPWAGQHVLDPRLLLEGKADLQNLQPFYELVHDAIREVDDRHIIFYEPTLVSTQVLPRNVGFTQGPGGDKYKDRHALAYHHYCPIGPNLKPSTTVACDWVFAELSFKKRNEDMIRLGGGGFLTEFGAVDRTSSEPGMDEVWWVVEMANKYLQSFSYWDYGPQGGHFSHSPEFVRTLVTPFPEVVAGTLTHISFVNATGDYLVSYKVGGDEVKVPETKVRFHSRYWYTSGVDVRVQPEGHATWVVEADGTGVTFTHTAAARAGDEISITLTAAVALNSASAADTVI